MLSNLRMHIFWLTPFFALCGCVWVWVWACKQRNDFDENWWSNFALQRSNNNSAINWILYSKCPKTRSQTDQNVQFRNSPYLKHLMYSFFRALQVSLGFGAQQIQLQARKIRLLQARNLADLRSCEKLMFNRKRMTCKIRKIKAKMEMVKKHWNDFILDYFKLDVRNPE